MQTLFTEYKNSFYSARNQDSKPVIQTTAVPVEYKGYLIYHRLSMCFDIVIDGICIGMNAGINGAKKRIDQNYKQ
jgi:hypothetical protein